VRDGERFSLRFDTADGSSSVECDYVVFALPFTKLREVDLDDAGLSDDKRVMIDELGYGTNAKIMAAFSSRPWLEQGASGSVTSDSDLQQTWDSSIGQDGEQGILTFFVGGERGVEVGDGEAEDWVTEVLGELDAIYPGTEAAFVEGSPVRMHWPTHEFTRGSYSCYRPGQWAFWGTEGWPESNMHFCGEHTSPEFQGWMEGAAETGGRVAIEILKALDLPIPKALADVVDDVTALPEQELLRFGFSRRLNRLAARR
jgi:monoamine oxidase